MRRIIAVFIVLMAAAPLRAQVSYFKVAREVVEQRSYQLIAAFLAYVDTQLPLAKK